MLMIGDPIYPGGNYFDLDWEARARANMGGDIASASAPDLENVASDSHAQVSHVYEGPLGPGELYCDGPTAGSVDAHFNFSALRVSY